MKSNTYNQEEWESLVDLYGDLVYRIAFQNMKCKSDAEDVSQEVYMKIFKKLPTHISTNEQKAWIIRVTINTCKDLWRYNKRRKTDEFLEEYDYINQKTVDHHIIDEVRTLSSKYRNVIFLHYYEGYSVKEIAEILKKKEATILTWLHRARKQLKGRLEEDHEGL